MLILVYDDYKHLKYWYKNKKRIVVRIDGQKKIKSEHVMVLIIYNNLVTTPMDTIMAQFHPFPIPLTFLHYIHLD
jgi:hypothetical protein